MKRVFALLSIAAALLLSGCSTFYTFDGKQYNSKAKFLSAVDQSTQDGLATITPFATPVTQKKLLFALPSPAVISAASARYYAQLKGSPPPPVQVDLFDGLARGTFRSARGFYEAAAKKNIYKSVRFMELDSMTASPSASAEEDVIYYFESGQGSGTYYYVSAKTGKQVFAYDRAQAGTAGKMQAFLEALQLQAIRD